LPPVSAQNRKELAVQLLAVDADDDCLSPQRGVTLSASAAVPAIPFPGEFAGTRLKRRDTSSVQLAIRIQIFEFAIE
jgi:hypothetical protein